MATPDINRFSAHDSASVRIYFLGRFQIEKPGSDSAPQRGGRRTLELLKRLVAEGGHATADDLAYEMWSDVDGDRAHGNLTSGLRRLRDLIGPKSVALEGGHLRIDQTVCWVDALAFEALQAAAQRAFASGDVDTARSQAEAALSLYRGWFLDGEFEIPSVLGAREKHHAQFVNLVLDLGSVYENRDDPKQAVRLYQQGIQIDDLRDEFVCRLMECYRRLGQFVQAIAAYETYERIAQAKVGGEPSPDAKALCDRIRAELKAREPPPPDGTQAPPPPESPEEAVAPAQKEEKGPSPSGERRIVTVVFSDLTDYTNLASRLDAEELEDVMAVVYSTADEVIRRHGGIVNSIAGDEIMSVFGVPTPSEEDPRRAVAAALELHDEIVTRTRDLPRLEDASLRLHTGVATGSVLVRSNDRGGDRYQLIGVAVPTGARLSTLARPGEILISPQTHEWVAPYFRMEALQPAHLKGLSDPLIPYRVIEQQSSVRDRFDAAIAAGLTPYVSRERELAELEKCLAAAAGGAGRLVTIRGDPGIGKSRLMYELRRSGNLEAFSVLRGNCQSQARTIPYHPFVELLRQGLRLPRSPIDDRAIAKLRRMLHAISPSLDAYLPHYLHLFNLTVPGYELPKHLVGEALRPELETAIAAIITLNLEHRPMLLLLEDWQWCDEASESVLRNLADVIARYPIMVVVNYRPDYKGDWGSHAHHVHLELRSLDVEETDRLACAVLGAKQLPEQFAGQVLERTGGNTFFIEELCRSLLTQSIVRVEDGRAKLSGALEDLALPPTVEAIIQARLGNLNPAARELAGLAAVLGDTFDGDLLERLATSQLPVAAAMDALRQNGMIQLVRAFPVATYRFNHAITRSVVYEALLRRTRTDLHEQVGAALEAMHADRLEEHYETIAYHYDLSGNHRKALKYLELAADKAARVYSLQEARVHFGSAIRHLNALDSDYDLELKRCELAVKWGQVSFYAPHQELREVLLTAHRAMEEAGDTANVLRLTYWMAVYDYADGNVLRSMQGFERCLDMGEDTDPRIYALAVNYLGRLGFYRANYDEAIDYLNDGIARLEQMQHYAEQLNSMGVLVMTHSFRGSFDPVPELTSRIFDMAETLRNPTIRSMGFVCTGLADVNQGNWEAAKAALSEAEQLSRTSVNPLLEGYALWGQGCSEVMLGNHEPGLRMMRDGIAVVERHSTLGLTACCGLLAERYAVLGNFEEAQQYAKKALKICESGERMGEASAKYALATVAAKRSPPDWPLAQDLMEESIAVARSQGGGAQLARGLLHYATMLSERGQNDQAQTYLDEARQLFASMRMDWWRAQADAIAARLAS